MMEQKLLQILMFDSQQEAITYSRSGLQLRGPWGQQPFQTLSDGYRSTSQWVLDFISWAIYADRFAPNAEIGGILLIDEIEQHLHPLWQRYMVQQLREQFPKTQIIVTTHTPLIVSGMADIHQSFLLKLNQGDEGRIEPHMIDTALLAGQRADQVLTSDAFDLPTSRNPGSEDEMDRYVTLAGKVTRTEAEEAEFQSLGDRLQASLNSQENQVAQMVERAIHSTLTGMVDDVSPAMQLETQKQLRSLLDLESNDAQD